MRKLHVVVLVLVVIIGCELYVLSFVRSINIPSSSSTLAKNTEQINAQVAKKNYQDRFMQVISGYIQDAKPTQNKLSVVSSYSGIIKEITNVNPNIVNLVIQDKNNNILQSYVKLNRSGIVVYKKEGSNLLLSSMDQVKKNDNVLIREFEEVVKDSMSVEDTKNTVNYIEITLVGNNL